MSTTSNIEHEPNPCAYNIYNESMKTTMSFIFDYHNTIIFWESFNCDILIIFNINIDLYVAVSVTDICIWII